MAIVYKDWKVTYIEDCNDNQGGYWCQVYNKHDEVLGDTENLDDFCIHPEELNADHSNLEQLIIEYLDENFVRKSYTPNLKSL